MNKFARIPLILLAVISLAGCDKTLEKQDPHQTGGTDPLDPAARVVRVITEYTAGGHNVSDINYDSKGRMTKLTGGMLLGSDGVCSIEYNDASNTATAKYEGESMVMELDENGRCVNDGYWRYTYFGGHLVSSQSISGSGIWSYSWENDCLTDIGHKTKASSGITYDTHDNPFYGQSYDPFCSIDQGAFTEAMCLCFCAMSSKKLYKSYYGTDFSYTFSEDGRLKEAMMSYDGVPQAIFYASYSDETLRQPRDEKTESLPSYLKGDWIITGRVEDGSEIPGLELFGWSFTVPGTERQLETSLNIYRLQEGSLQTLPIEVNGNNAKYFNGVLSGVIGEPYDVDHMKDNIVYKSDHLHLVGYDGEWKEGLKVTKINENKFYCKGFSHDPNIYVYERVTELSDVTDVPAIEFQAGSIFIFNDVKSGICNLAILEQGLSIDETSGELSGTGNTAYFILTSNGGGEDELAAGTYLSNNSTIKAESMIFTSPEEFAKMSGKAITDATLTVSRDTKGEEIYYSGSFEFSADGKKFSGSFKDLVNSVKHEEIVTPDPPAPEKVTIRVQCNNGGGTKSSLSNDGMFNLEQGDIVYVNGLPYSIQENGVSHILVVPYCGDGYYVIYSGNEPVSVSSNGNKQEIGILMPENASGKATPVCMGYIPDASQTCILDIMTGVLEVSLAEGINAAGIELSAETSLSGKFTYSITNNCYLDYSVTPSGNNSTSITVKTSQVSGNNFFFNIIPGTYKFKVRLKDNNGDVIIEKQISNSASINRATMYKLSINASN